MIFSGRHIVVTGASTGIGFATLKTLSHRHASASLLTRSEGKLATATAALQREDGMAGYAVADVGSQNALQAAITKAERAFGPVDGLIANAGSGGAFLTITDYVDDLFDEVILTNLTSIFWSFKRDPAIDDGAKARCNCCDREPR